MVRIQSQSVPSAEAGGPFLLSSILLGQKLCQIMVQLRAVVPRHHCRKFHHQFHLHLFQRKLVPMLPACVLPALKLLARSTAGPPALLSLALQELQVLLRFLRQQNRHYLFQWYALGEPIENDGSVAHALVRNDFRQGIGVDMV